MLFRYIDKVALIFAACYLLFAAAQAQEVEEPNYTDVDLGEREAGTSYPLALGAENRNCAQPLDFRFSSSEQWLRMPADPVVRQVPAGQTRQIEATLDLTNVQPGQYEVLVDVDCDNCGFFIFKNCKIDKQQLRLLLRVNAAPAPPGGQQPAQGAPLPPGAPLLSPPPPQVDYKDKRIPKPLRRKAKAAYEAWTLALKKAKDCADELAKLQAAAKAAKEKADKAKVAAGAAEQKASDAKSQKKAAQEELKNANIAVNKAQDALDKANSDLKYANSRDGITADRVAAKAALKKAEAEKKAADKRLADAAKASRQLPKPKDIAKLDKDAKKKRKAADAAAAAATAAENAVAKKQAECLKLQQAAAAAQTASEKADKDAKDAIPPAPVDRTAEKIKKQREKVGKCAIKLGQLLEAQRLALEVMAKLGALGDDYESDLKAWADGVDDAKKFFDDLPPGIPFVDTVVSTLTAVRSIMGIASGVIAVGNTVHTPKSGNDVKSPADTKQWIIDNKFTKDPAEAERIYEQMKKYSETDSTEKMLKELDYQKKLCKSEEAKLEAMTEAAKGK